jgi:hypothetical protein
MANGIIETAKRRFSLEFLRFNFLNFTFFTSAKKPKNNSKKEDMEEAKKVMKDLLHSKNEHSLTCFDFAYSIGKKSFLNSQSICGEMITRKHKTAKYGRGVLSRFLVSFKDKKESKMVNPSSNVKYFAKNPSPKKAPKSPKYISLLV